MELMPVVDVPSRRGVKRSGCTGRKKSERRDKNED